MNNNNPSSNKNNCVRILFLIVIALAMTAPASAILITKSFDADTQTLTIMANGNPVITIQEVSNISDLTFFEEIFKITPNINYTLSSSKDLRIRWQRFSGTTNPNNETNWFILRNVSYNLSVDDYSIVTNNTQNANGTWDNRTIEVISGSHNITEIRQEWQPATIHGLALEKNISIFFKLRLTKKAELGNVRIQTIPTFNTLEEPNLTWWDNTYDSKVIYNITNGESGTVYNLSTQVNKSDRWINESDNTAIPFYYNNTAEGYVFLNLTANGSYQISKYVNNTDAYSNISNLNTTFIYGNNGSNLYNLNTATSSAGTVSIFNNEFIRLTTSRGSNHGARITTNFNISPPYHLISRTKSNVSNNAYKSPAFGINNLNTVWGAAISSDTWGTQGTTYLFRNATTGGFYVDGTQKNNDYTDNSSFHTYTVSVPNLTTTDFWDNGTWLVNGGAIANNANPFAAKITSHDSFEGVDIALDIDYVYIYRRNTTTNIVFYGQATNTTPPSPVNASATKGNFWINTTWESGGTGTDGYNVTNGTLWVYNGSNLYVNLTNLTPHSSQNLSIFSYNSSSGILSNSSANVNTTIPNNIPTFGTSSVSSISVQPNTAVTISLNNVSDLDNDTLTVTVGITRLAVETNYTMTNTAGTSNYTYSFSTGVSDTYTVAFYANDSYTVAKKTTSLSFEVVTPSSSGGGGGGGGGSIVESKTVIVKEPYANVSELLPQVNFVNTTDTRSTADLEKIGQCLSKNLMLSSTCAGGTINIVTNPMNYWVLIGAFIGSFVLMYFLAIYNEKKISWFTDPLIFGVAAIIITMIFTLVGFNMFFFNYLFNDSRPLFMTASFAIWGGFVSAAGFQIMYGGKKKNKTFEFIIGTPVRQTNEWAKHEWDKLLR